MADYSYLLPYELREKELFKMVLDLLDYIDDTEESDVSVEIFEELLTKVFTDYTDTEAVLAYFNLCIRPQVGTHTAMNLALKLVGIDGYITEWFNTGDSAFEFGVETTSIPPTVDITSFIELLYLLKNERSWLIAMHILLGAGLFVWDVGQWSNGCYSSPFGGGAVTANYDVVEISYP